MHNVYILECLVVTKINLAPMEKDRVIKESVHNKQNMPLSRTEFWH